ncbi:enolase C-terminal domain-like protein [Haladaptatus caseinilyticus]|uniref:enolase C-terminal domain-like protein n=1 Tax=Haladaptatus caseinilyticus TaxID=2993314 RepID=UPI002E21480D
MFREAVNVPIAADGSDFTPQDAIQVEVQYDPDITNIKIGKSGSLTAADIIAIAQGANIDLMIGCLLESAMGIPTSAHVAAGTDAFSYVDLDGNRLLAMEYLERSLA